MLEGGGVNQTMENSNCFLQIIFESSPNEENKTKNKIDIGSVTKSTDDDINSESNTTPYYHHLYIKIIHEGDYQNDDKYYPHFHAPQSSKNNSNQSMDDQIFVENNSTTEISFTTTTSEVSSETFKIDVIKPTQLKKTEPKLHLSFSASHLHWQVPTTPPPSWSSGKVPNNSDHSNVMTITLLI